MLHVGRGRKGLVGLGLWWVCGNDVIKNPVQRKSRLGLGRSRQVPGRGGHSGTVPGSVARRCVGCARVKELGAADADACLRVDSMLMIGHVVPPMTAPLSIGVQL